MFDRLTILSTLLDSGILLNMQSANHTTTAQCNSAL